jgi:hypothetical protein
MPQHGTCVSHKKLAEPRCAHANSAPELLKVLTGCSRGTHGTLTGYYAYAKSASELLKAVVLIGGEIAEKLRAGAPTPCT